MSTQACADLLHRGDPDRFLATMAAPVWARDILFPIYAFNVEVARAPWMTKEPMIAEMRLQWWRDMLTEIASGGGVRRHEIATPLAGVLDGAGAEALDRLVLARRRDTGDEPFADAEDFESYLADTGGVLMEVATAALGGMDSGPAALLGQVGALTNYLLAVPALIAAGRRPLPDLDEAAISTLAGRYLARLSKGPLATHRPSREMKIAGLSAWRTRAILGQARRDPGAVLDGRLGTSEFRRRVSLLKAAWMGG